MIPYGRQDITDEDIAEVAAILRSDFLTQGPKVGMFEQAVAEYVGARFGVAVNSATSALHIACIALGVTRGDLVWTVPNTFVASANCARYCGADVDFVDIDPRTYNMSVASLKKKFATASRNGRLPRVIIPVHFAGQSCEMRSISELARQHGCRVIEDASHAVGAAYLDDRVGSCRYSDIAVFSFHPVKIMTTAEGGLLLTNDEELRTRLELLRSNGVTRDPSQMRSASEGPWYYQQTDLGFNFRMTDIQAALGCSQIQRLDRFVARRRDLADRYFKAFEGAPLILPHQHPDTESSWHLFVIQLPEGVDRGRVFRELREADIGVNVHYIPVHLQPYYRELGFAEGDYPEAEGYYRRALTIPLYFGLSGEMQDQVVDAVTRLL